MAIEEHHATDAQGRPAGGTTTAPGVRIAWQDKPLGRGPLRTGQTGAFVEDVLKAALGRLRHYQAVADGMFASRENALAITHVEEALHWLRHRTEEREARGVEGTHEP
jgi:hypothetical protein